MKTVITNTKLVTENKVFADRAIVIENSKISALPRADSVEPTHFDRVFDAQGAYASAGWIELHTHGISGYDFMDADSEGAVRAMHEYAKHGVTGVFPTTMSAPFEEIERALDSLAAAGFNGGAEFLGVHLEGPYFSPEQCGAQPTARLRTPADGEYARIIQKYPFIARIDSAPELEGSEEMAKYLTERGIVCGIAHTDANSATALSAIDAGYRIATHLYSGMSGVHRENGFRYGGTVEACLLRDEVFCEAICDGIHLPSELLKLIYKVKGSEKMVLVTDSMRGAAMNEGECCMLGNQSNGTPAVISDGVAWLADRSAFAGSVATYERLIRTATRLADIPLPEAITMATRTPARAMGIKNKGVLATGYDADITVFDDDIQILLTVVGGKIQYEKKEK